ncbi:MAG: InlB B-repeat-containing protein, partial [Clostridia bacterium]|nr:InlB B-repeat-containing protein [Clostridia bacterium]
YIDSFGGDGAAGIGSGKNSRIGSLTVSGNADVLCVGGKEGAGLGGGSGSSPEAVNVAGNSRLIAVGGLCGAGIGSGYGASYPAITVSGAASVRAQGGNYGAGIGSGGRETPETETPTAKIVLTDQSIVSAYGGKSASGVGGGVFGSGSILEVSQNAAVTSGADNTVSVKGSSDGLSFVSPNADPIKLGDYAIDSIPPLPAKPSYIDDPASPTVTPPAQGDSENFPYIVYAPSSTAFEANQKEYDTLGIEANAAGNGAGCTSAGSIHISGGASLNGQVGDVTLTLVLGEGATDMVITLVKNASYTLPESVTKTGYTFRGWYDDYDLTQPVSGTVQVSGDRLIYAAWTAVQVELSDSQITPAVKDVFYSYAFETSSGADSTSFVVTKGEVPAGMILSGDGVLKGTPVLAGKYTFTVAYLNSNGTSGAREVNLTVLTNNTYTFVFKTGTADGADTRAQIMMSFEFTDRLSGEKRVTQSVNITDFLRAYYDNPFRAGAEESLPLVFEPNVGEPENVILTCDSDDGWFCESVKVVSEGNAAADAFQKEFEINAWIGREQNVKAGRVFLIVVAVVLGLILIAAAVFVILAKNPKTRRFLKEKGFFKNEKQK